MFTKPLAKQLLEYLRKQTIRWIVILLHVNCVTFKLHAYDACSIRFKYDSNKESLFALTLHKHHNLEMSMVSMITIDNNSSGILIQGAITSNSFI